MLQNEYVAPRNEIEQAIAGIWQSLLGVEKTGIHDNFFEAGGHSLLATRVVSAIRKQLNAELSISLPAKRCWLSRAKRSSGWEAQ